MALGTPQRAWLIGPVIAGLLGIAPRGGGGADVSSRVGGLFFAEPRRYRTRQGFFGSNFQPGIRNCIATASSREPEGSFR